MAEKAKQSIKIDLNQFKLHVDLKKQIALTLHFNSPSRRFYLSLIALVVHEMRKRGKIIPISMEEHLDLLALFNESIGGAAGSSERENLLPRIYRKWHLALPNLEDAPLFKVLGRKKEYNGGVGKTYQFIEAEKDNWANLFEYKGSEENVRLKFAIDKLGLGLDDIVILYGDSLNTEAWESFISSLKRKGEEIPATGSTNRLFEEPGTPESTSRKWKIAWLSRYRWIVLIAVVGSVLGAATFAIWKISFEPPSIKVASIERMAFPLPDKPSIALLPFVNMSDDAKHEFLGDGITESIISALSKVPRLFVISRQSTFSYKGKPVKVKQVSEELGVRYVLEGSVQRSADRIRISAQLIDALTGHHLWAGRYDRDLKDLFALQDEITIKILTATRVKLTDGEQASIAEKHFTGPQGLDCYLKLMEGMGYVQRWNLEDNNLGQRMIEEAIALCPENPVGYISLGWTYHHEYALGGTQSSQETIKKSMELAQKALALDDSLAGAHALLCQLYATKGEYDKAIAEGERAVALSPGGADTLSEYAWSLNAAGRSEEAIPLFQKVIRLNPFGKFTLYRGLGVALMNTGRLEEAVSAFKKAIQGSPNDIMSHINLAAAYTRMGREDEARAEAAEVLRINPKFSLDSFAKRLPPPMDQSRRNKYIDDLRKAGLK
jgi:TolB-like protein/Tfp pilus assembly protein PilF